MTPPLKLPAKVKETARSLKARWHPRQVQALTILIERGPSTPTDVALALGLTANEAGNISYHIQELEKRGLAEFVCEEKRRGHTAHVYRATDPLIVSTTEAEEMSVEERLDLSCWVVTLINGDFGLAIESKSIDQRPDRQLNRFPMRLDEQGYKDLFEEYERLFRRTLEIKAESEERQLSSGEKGQPVSAVLAMFPMPVV